MKKDILRLESICKAGVLYNFRMNLFEGEILALTGLSNSEISVIGDILDGVTKIDSGFIWFDEKKVTTAWLKNKLNNEIMAMRGVISLVGSMTVAENLFVVPLRLHNGVWVRFEEIERQALEILNELNINIAPHSLVKDLTPEQQRIIEIIKAMILGTRLIVIEDVWDGYNQSSREALFSLIQKVRDIGMTFLIITRHHEHIAEISDRIVLMRDGQNIFIFDRAEYCRDTVYRLLIGRDFYLPSEPLGKTAVTTRKELLRVENLTCNYLNDLNFSAAAGEVFGLFDVQELYTNEFVNILINGQQADGIISICGNRIHFNNRLDAMRCGVGMITHLDGSMLNDNLTWPENLALMYKQRLRVKNPIIMHQIIKMLTNEFEGALDGLDPKKPLGDTGASIYTRMKLMYLKWIVYKPKLLVCLRPCASGDVLTREVSISGIRQAAKRGICVLVISSDPDEISMCCDRIGIISEGHLSHDLSSKAFLDILIDGTNRPNLCPDDGAERVG